jgi:hypothetical protein
MLKHKAFLAFLILIGLISSGVQAQIADASKDTLHTALRDYFKVTEDQIDSLLKTPVPDEEMPIVLFIAQRAGVDPGSVLVVWSSGLNWMQTAHHFGLNPWLFFIPIQGDLKNTPYLKPYHYFKDRNNRVRLSDDDMINLVNLKFIAEQYNRDPKEIVQLRAQGQSFRAINDHYAQSNDAAQWDIPVPQVQGSETPTTASPRHSRHGGGHGLSAPSSME